MIRPLSFVAVVLAATPAFAQIDETRVKRIEAVIDASGLSGDVYVTDRADGEASFAHFGLLPEVPSNEDDGIYWRWASVTKQIVAILVMQQVAEGKVSLDTPVSRYLPAFASPNAASVTVRQLLQHRSGLPNPDDTAQGDAFPAYYQPGYTGSRDPLAGYCAGPPRGEPGGDWSYNNCDYLVLGALLEAVTGKSWTALFEERIARPLGLDDVGAYPTTHWTRPGQIDGKPEPSIDLSSYGSAAGLFGDPAALLKIDMALLNGKLLPPDALAELWRGDPALGYMALGQWAFEAPVAGCPAPLRIVERRGAVGGIGVRNIILPDLKIAIVALSDSEPFDFGEIWSGQGFSHDLLSAVVCPEPKDATP